MVSAGSSYGPMVIEGVTQKRHPNLFPTKSQQLSMLIFPGFLPHSSWKMPKNVWYISRAVAGKATCLGWSITGHHAPHSIPGEALSNYCNEKLGKRFDWVHDSPLGVNSVSFICMSCCRISIFKPLKWYGCPRNIWQLHIMSQLDG